MALLPSTGPAFVMPSLRPTDPKRPTEHSDTQKVGRTPQNTMRSRNYAASSLPDGYETP